MSLPRPIGLVPDLLEALEVNPFPLAASWQPISGQPENCADHVVEIVRGYCRLARLSDGLEFLQKGCTCFFMLVRCFRSSASRSAR